MAQSSWVAFRSFSSGSIGDPDNTPSGGVPNFPGISSPVPGNTSTCTLRDAVASVHAQRTRFIKEAGKLGFSLDKVSDLLALEDGRLCRKAEPIGAGEWASVQERMS